MFTFYLLLCTAKVVSRQVGFGYVMASVFFPDLKLDFVNFKKTKDLLYKLLKIFLKNLKLLAYEESFSQKN